MTKRVPPYSPRSVPARFGWSWTTKASTSRNGRRSARLPRRSAARARHCVTGCGRPSLTRAYGLVQRRTSASASRRSSARTASCGKRTRSPAFAGAGSAEGICLFCPGGARPPVQTMIAFIDEPRARHGVEPICRVLPIAPSTYHAHAARRADPGKLPARAQRDITLTAEIRRVYEENFRVYGIRKVWRQLLREGTAVARCTVARLMRTMGLRGVVRGKRVRTTISNAAAPCPLDRVNRQFNAPRPNALWVSDFTYVATWAGFVYVAFVIDVFARRIVGWRVSRTAHAGFVLDALEKALLERRPVRGGGLGHHSDRGQYVSIKYTERLAKAGVEPSVGSVGDSGACPRAGKAGPGGQCPRRNHQRALQSRGHPSVRTLAQLRSRRVCHSRMGRVVQQTSPSRADREHPSR